MNELERDMAKEIQADMFADPVPDSTDFMNKLHQVIELKNEVKDAETEIKLCKQQLAQLEEETFQIMENHGIQNISVGGYMLYRKTAIYCSVKADNKPAAYDWLETEGYNQLFQKTVNARTLTAAMKELMTSGGEIPDEFINVSTKNQIGMRKGT